MSHYIKEYDIKMYLFVGVRVQVVYMVIRLAPFRWAESTKKAP